MRLILSRKFWLAMAILVLAACSSPEEKIAEFLAQADALYSQGEYVKADVMYRNVLQINANHVPALYRIARIAERQGDLQKSYGLYTRLVEAAPEHVPGRVRLGKLLLAAGQLDLALEQSNAANALAPDDPGVLTLRAGLLYRLADPEGAVDAAKAALAADPGNADALLILAAERLAADDPEAAINYLDRGIKDDEDNISLQVFKIQALAQLEQVDKAVEVFKHLIEYYPDNVAFHYSLAHLYLANDDLDAAESVYRNLAETQTADVKARLDVIRFLSIYRNNAAAEKQLLDYIEESPDEYPLRLGLARLYLHTGDQAKARAVYEEVVERDGNGQDGLDARNRLALMALADGDHATAARMVDEVLAADARNTQGLINRARIQLQARETDPAIANLRAVLKDEPGASQALLLLARAHIQSGAPELARDYYVRAIRADPTDVAISLEYAANLVRAQSYDQAEQVLESILVMQPRNVVALKAMAQVKLSQQDWAAAQQLAERLQSLEGEQAAAEQIQGVALQGLRQYQQSIDAFKRAHDASPSAAQPMVAVVRTYVQMGKNDDARGFLESVLTVDEDNIYAQLLLGRLALLEGDRKAAERAFRAAIASAPENQGGYSDLAGLYGTNGQFDEARAILEQGLEKIPDDLNMRMSLAAILEVSGDVEGAIGIYEAILADNPSVDVAANNLASALTEHRSDEESLKRALELAERFRRSDMPYYQDTLGWVYHRLGKDEDALPLLEDAVEALPEFPVFRYHLGMSYLNANETDKARAELEQALAQGEFPGKDEAQRALESLTNSE